MPGAAESALVPALIDWFDANARPLPWRRPGVGGWPILVSEMMLQQTPVARVLPVYAQWLARWPSAAALAADSAGEAVRAWGRLGYPRRALRLHECARQLAERHGGVVPADLQALLALPGVGDYTARAVLAFAHRQRAAVVDTNVRRVLARVVDGRQRPGPISTVRDLAAMSRLLPADGERSARFSAAVMELGATICVSQSPRCQHCPIVPSCGWRAAGYPASEDPAPHRQPFAGTDRQVRGLLLALLRSSDAPVPRAEFDLMWPDADQRNRALGSLIRDGLAVESAGDQLSLPP